jgi:peroxiredoxin
MRVALLASMFAGCVPRLYTDGAGEQPSEWEPPENTWTVTAPPADLEGEGYAKGEVVPDFRLVDQHGDEVSAWQFYGNVILLDVSTIWCGPCQQLALETEETWHEYRDQGFVYVTVLQEDLEAHPPDGEDLLFWADSFGITAPVLADGDKTGVTDVPDYPTVLVIGRNMKVRDVVDPPDDARVRAAIEDVL